MGENKNLNALLRLVFGQLNLPEGALPGVLLPVPSSCSSKCKQKLLRAYNKHALHLFLWSLIFTILVPVLLMTFFLFFKKNETFQQKKKMHGSLRSEPYRKCSICSVDCRLQSTLRALSFENWLHSLNSTEQHKKTTRQLQHVYKLHIILCLVF